MTPRISLRTLVLMLELLVAVVGFQCVTAVRPAPPGAVWLAGSTSVLLPPSAPPVNRACLP